MGHAGAIFRAGKGDAGSKIAAWNPLVLLCRPLRRASARLGRSAEGLIVVICAQRCFAARFTIGIASIGLADGSTEPGSPSGNKNFIVFAFFAQCERITRPQELQNRKTYIN